MNVACILNGSNVTWVIVLLDIAWFLICKNEIMWTELWYSFRICPFDSPIKLWDIVDLSCYYNYTNDT